MHKIITSYGACECEGVVIAKAAQTISLFSYFEIGIPKLLTVSDLRDVQCTHIQASLQHHHQSNS